MDDPLFDSCRAKGITPHRLPNATEENGVYTWTAMPDLIPTSSGQRMHKGAEHLFLENSWRAIEFLPDSNYEFLQSTLRSARAFREGHTGRTGFFTAFHYLPEPPHPLWTRHLSCPEFPNFERRFPTFNHQSPVDGGFAFFDTHSLWAIYGQQIPDYGLTFLCLSTHHFIPSPAFRQAVRDLARDHGLCLVDWGHLCIVATNTMCDFESWISRYT